MEKNNRFVCSNKDRRILKVIQEPGLDIENLFHRHILKDSEDCWNWIGTKLSSGYGHIRLGSIYCYVHRFSYILFKGLIPLRYQVDHICGNRSCCNPEHLEAVTPHENKIRAGFLIPKIKKKSTEYFRRGIEIDEQKYQSRRFRKTKMIYVKKKKVTQNAVDLRFKKFLSNL